MKKLNLWLVSTYLPSAERSRGGVGMEIFKRHIKLVVYSTLAMFLVYLVIPNESESPAISTLQQTFNSDHIQILDIDNFISFQDIVIPEKSDQNFDKTWSMTYPNRDAERASRFGVATGLTFNKKHLSWKGGRKLPKDELERIARNTFKLMPHIKTNDDNVALVVETAIAESDGGRIITNKFGDHGVFQIKVRTSKDLLKWLKYGHKDIHEAIVAMRNPRWSEKDNLQKNIPYACAICITEYWRKAGSQYYLYISSLEERGKMWKSVYNTHRGYGTVDSFIKRNQKYETATIVAQK